MIISSVDGLRRCGQYMLDYQDFLWMALSCNAWKVYLNYFFEILELKLPNKMQLSYFPEK